MTRFFPPLILLSLFASTPIDALSMTRTPSPYPKSQLNRRTAVGWIGSLVGSAVIIQQPQPSLAATVDSGLNVNDFLKTGQVAMPMGVAGQAGKSRPETGVTLRDGSDVSRDPRTGDVLAEIIVQDAKNQQAAVVLASYSSPWPLAKGTVFDVECRDASTGDGAFLAVTPSVGGKSSVSELSDSFILNNLVKRDGRLSFYGPPTDVKIKSSQIVQANDRGSNNGASYKVMDLSYSIVSQATQTEIPRKARLAITIPLGSDQAVMLVASTSANRWNKGSNKLVASTIESFRAVPAPQTSMKIRSKPKKSDL